MKISDRIWNFIAPVYRILRKNPISGYFLNKEIRGIEILLKNLRSIDIKTVCDLGVGRGHSLDLVTGTYPWKVAIDKSMSMIRNTINNYSGTHFLLGDVLNLPIKDSSFDLVICIGLMEYLADIDSLIAQIYPTLKHKAFLLITSSPNNIFTFLRVLNGHRIYARNSTDIEKQFLKYHFEILDVQITPMQHQYLLQKKKKFKTNLTN
jgi:ubiquinone/menaquinone biosynthesis C-methylase UbiE